MSALATDGKVLAYPNADFTSLWWSPSLTTAPRRLFATGNAASHVDNSVQVAGRYVSFGVPPAAFLLDTVTRRYLKLSAGGWTRIDARDFVLVKPSAKKAIHPISDVVFRPLAALPSVPLPLSEARSTRRLTGVWQECQPWASAEASSRGLSSRRSSEQPRPSVPPAGSS